MPKYVAVTDVISVMRSNSHLKRAALMFEHVSLAGMGVANWFERYIDDPRLDDLRRSLTEIDWLRERGVIVDAPPELGSSESLDNLLDGLMAPNEEAAKLRRTLDELARSKEAPVFIKKATEGITRRAAARLMEKTGWDTVVLAAQDTDSNPLLHPGSDSVAHIILQSIPEPDENTSWEYILDYRDDAEVQGRFFRLKTWINTLVEAKRSPNELEDELRELIFEYEEHMRLHRMKASSGVVETVITMSAEVLEGLIKLNWSNAAKALFTIQHQRIALLEAERTAPGRQIAYIVDLRKRFGR